MPEPHSASSRPKRSNPVPLPCRRRSSRARSARALDSRAAPARRSFAALHSQERARRPAPPAVCRHAARDPATRGWSGNSCSARRRQDCGRQLGQSACSTGIVTGPSAKRIGASQPDRLRLERDSASVDCRRGAVVTATAQCVPSRSSGPAERTPGNGTIAANSPVVILERSRVLDPTLGADSSSSGSMTGRLRSAHSWRCASFAWSKPPGFGWLSMRSVRSNSKEATTGFRSSSVGTGSELQQARQASALTRQNSGSSVPSKLLKQATQRVAR